MTKIQNPIETIQRAAHAARSACAAFSESAPWQVLYVAAHDAACAALGTLDDKMSEFPMALLGESRGSLCGRIEQWGLLAVAALPTAVVMVTPEGEVKGAVLYETRAEAIASATKRAELYWHPSRGLRFSVVAWSTEPLVTPLVTFGRSAGDGSCSMVVMRDLETPRTGMHYEDAKVCTAYSEAWGAQDAVASLLLQVIAAHDAHQCIAEACVRCDSAMRALESISASINACARSLLPMLDTHLRQQRRVCRRWAEVMCASHDDGEAHAAALARAMEVLGHGSSVMVGEKLSLDGVYGMMDALHDAIGKE